MANPYKYSQQDYANALNRYNQSVAAHNRKIDEYNKTLAFDTQGRTLVKDKFNNTVFAVESDGNLVKSALPEGTTLTDYNYSALPDSDRYMLVRQGTPSEQINRSVLDLTKILIRVRILIYNMLNRFISRNQKTFKWQFLLHLEINR